MPRCPQCGHTVPEGARRCLDCSAALDLTATSPPRDPSPEAALDSVGSASGLHGRFDPGTRLGRRYRIVGLLGRGGMGEVYRADDLELGQSVALKFLPPRVASDAAALARFRNEVRTARHIAHPNICRIYDIAEQDGHVFLSMEYIDGEDLAGVLRRLGRPSREKAVEIARQMCLGLAAAHENKVLHRDLKPANIMIDGRGRVRITDFGLAGFLDELAGSPERAGTPAYMAPEQLADGRVSVRSDIYTLGLILYELFTGKGVFRGRDIEELQRSHASGSVSTPSSITEEIDPAVERVILRCLESQPERRPQSVYEVLAALPGGDPLAAALAAGEIPSPELVANARDVGGLRPLPALVLLAATAASLGVTYFIYAGSAVLPTRSPAVLAVVAEQVMEDFGYGDLPRNSVSGYNVNRELSETLQAVPRSREELVSLEWPPKYRYWRRWSRGSFVPMNYHVPEGFQLDGPTSRPAATGSVALDSTGRLLGLVVGPELCPAPAGPAPPPDWSPLFRRADLDRARASEVPLVKQPPVHCDAVAAWRIPGFGDDGDGETVQMGVVNGHPNYFEIVGLDSAMVGPFPGLTTMIMNPALNQVVILLMIVLAWRNLRASRGDRRNAFRAALVIAALYALLHWLALFLQADPMFDGRGVGHVVHHAFEVWVVYMAVEPFVRRVWPRMLVGVMRLLSGRLRDPAVGREVLIGTATGCGLVAVLALTRFADLGLQSADAAGLPHWLELTAMQSVVPYLCYETHRVAWTCVGAAMLAALLVAIRLLVRHTRAAMVVGIGAIGVMAYLWFMEFAGRSVAAAVVYATIFGVTVMMLYTRAGVLSAIVTVFLVLPFHRSLSGFGTWAAAHTTAEFVVPAALAAYGVVVALAGQPLFKDLLAEPQPKS